MKMVIVPKLIFFVFVLLLQTKLVLAKQPPFWVITSIEPPFSQLDSRGHLTGLTIDTVKGILREAGIEQEILVAPWERVFKEAQSKSNVLLFSIARLPERENDFFWISPLTNNIVGIFSLNGQFVSDIEQLERNEKYAVLDGDYRIDVLQQAGINNIVKLQNWGQGVTALVNGEVKNVFLSSIGIQYFCHQLNLDCSQVKQRFVYRQVTSYLALSKGSDMEMVTKLIEAAENYKRSAQYSQITQQWLTLYQQQNGLHAHLDKDIINLWAKQ
ncbi:MAG: transporter substrate-binding domain-containing protein [Paraglaciecola sp.]|nr:transporter substrate-binding domain-containing protein [Paraglaciecola sp.]